MPPEQLACRENSLRQQRCDLWSERYGNGAVTTTGYSDTLGRVASVETTRSGTSIQSIEHQYYANGNLRARVDNVDSSKSEHYEYDSLDRLTKVSEASVGSGGIAAGALKSRTRYDAAGNITERTEVGAYSYTSPRPHAVTYAGENEYDYDANGRQEYRRGPDVVGGVQELEYNAFGLPSVARIGEGSYETTVDFDYDVSGVRVRQAAPERTVVQFGSLFQRIVSNDGSTEHRHRIWGPHREVAQVVVREDGAGGAERRTFYLHANALGTPEVVTDETGAIVHEQFADAFGGFSEQVGGESGVLTGFTGHLQDIALGLVDMRGRLYDATIGRFLSPDPIIQAPYWSQGLNAYSYVFNNPLNFVDPTGYQAAPEGCGPGAPTYVNGEPRWSYVDCDSGPIDKSSTGGSGAARASTGEAVAAAALGVGVGAGFGAAASYGTGLAASLACGPGAPLCAAVVTGGITAALIGAGVYELWSGGAERIATSAARLASGDGTAEDYFLGGAIVGGFASGPMVPRFNTTGANHGLAVRSLVTRGGGTPGADAVGVVAARGSPGTGGSIRDVNPTGGKFNCANCAVATDATLAGSPASALPGGVTSAVQLASELGGHWLPTTGPHGIVTIMQSWGPGARGIVFGGRGADVGHFFNVANQRGVVRFLDGQAGGAADLSAGYSSFWLLRTH